MSVLSLSSGESSCRGRRSAAGATEEEAGSFVGTRIRGDQSETSLLGYGKPGDHGAEASGGGEKAGYLELPGPVCYDQSQQGGKHER